VSSRERLSLWGLIEELREGGMAIVLTTHQIQEAERLCSRVALMRSGRVAAVGSVPELLGRVPAQAVAVLQTRHETVITQRDRALGWAARPRAGEVSSVSLQPVTLELAYLELLGQPVGRNAKQLPRPDLAQLGNTPAVPADPAMRRVVLLVMLKPPRFR